MANEFSTKGAPCDSPGQRPGCVGAKDLQDLKGRHIGCFALSGLDGFLAVEPRTLSWAITLRPVGAGHAEFVDAAKNEQAVKANVRELSYG
jgi:hypothetical protein